MRKISLLYALLGVLLLVGCSSKIDVNQMAFLNGYWEITKAKMPDGTHKEFSINPSYDYFEIDSLDSGFKQKVMPQIDGHYLTNEVAEHFRFINEDNITYLKYETEFSQWKEQVVKLTQDELVVKNENDIIYYYRRPVPFTIK